MGLHWRASIKRAPRYLNIPYWPHRIIIIGWGRLDRHGRFHPRQPCVRLMALHRFHRVMGY